MTEKAAKTGVGPTVTVAAEQFFPVDQRLIHDDLAHQIVPAGMRAFIKLMRFKAVRNWLINASEKAAPGIWNGLMCRKRFIDEKLLESLDQVDAIVNLGAGFDTRVYRFPEVANTPVWEVDQPENIAPKKDRLQKIFGTVPAHVTLVPIDFDKESLADVLAAQGYSLQKPTFFIWEAVTQYLTEEGINAAFSYLAKAVPGSKLAFTYIIQDFIDNPGAYPAYAGLYQQYVAKGIWLFGLSPEDMVPFLGKYGWHLIEDLSYEELADTYVKPTGRDLPAMPIERMVFAEKD